MLKQLLLTFLLLTATLFAQDERLNHYTGATEWLKDANTNADSAFNLGVLYHKTIKDNDKAIYWYEKAYSLDKGNDAASNLGYLYDDLKKYNLALKWYTTAMKQNDRDATYNLALLYDDKLKDYPNAIKYYERAYNMGEIGGANGLGYLYEHSLNNTKSAEQWYKIAIKKNNQKAFGNLAKLYHKQNKDKLGAAYLLALANNGYSKEKVFTYLKDKWSLTDEEIQKAYELQLKLDIPKHYTGGVN